MCSDSVTSESAESCRELTSLRGDSPARTYPTQPAGVRDDLGLTENGAVFGLRCLGLLANLDRDTLLWRTYQLCLSGGWAEFSQTWPRSGTTRNGRAFRHR